MLEQPLLFNGCSSIQFFNSFFVTYETPCCARGHYSHLLHFPPNPSYGNRGFPWLWQMSSGCASAHILSLLATSLINNSGLIFICVKIMDVFTCGEKISKLGV